MLHLNHGDLIRGASWPSPFFASVFGVAGYAMKSGMDPEAARERAERLGHDIAASIYTGATLTDSRVFYDRIRADYARAVVLEEGDRVEIEGRDYIVRFNRGNERLPRNSDPIRFIPAPAEG